MRPRVRLGVLGWPVAHSRSPVMQNAALRAVGLGDWRYQLLPVPPELFAETVRALPDAGFRGANVTIPHKEQALQIADLVTPAAKAIGAANTLLFHEGEHAIAAENTDAPGLIASLPLDPRGASVLVLGAGGSARAAVWALLSAGAREIGIWNRTPGRASALADELGAVAVGTAAPADLLVNCTSSGLDASEKPFKGLPIGADDLTAFRCVVDFVYSDQETALVRSARARDIPVVDGLELLVAQGALSFQRFTTVPAPLEVMRAAVRRG